MKTHIKHSFAFFLIFFMACSPAKKNNAVAFKPDDLELYRIILQQDSIYFEAYNKCDMEQQRKMYNENIEFYHDKGGLMTNKLELLESIQRNICGKVTRELVAGSIEVYPIKGFGAIEIGLHKFHNNQEKETTEPRVGKFIIIWQEAGGKWLINRVVSLH